MKKINHLFRRSFIRNKGYFLTNIIIGLVGVIVVTMSVLLNDKVSGKTIFLSIGTSIIAASIVAFLDMLREEGVRGYDEKINDIIIIGGLENIYKRRDLDEYNDLIYNAKKSIDITGYSLRGFYESNKDIILKKCNENKNFLVRIILVDPKSQFSISRDIEENEQGSQLFFETFNNLIRWSKKTDNIQIKLINAPLSNMIYRIDDVMYTGPYFYRTSSKETYTNRLNYNGWLYKAYQENFNKLWDEAGRDI